MTQAHDRKNSDRKIANQLMLAFEGLQPPEAILAWLRERGAAGFTLFRPLNVESPAQVRALTAALQAAARETNPGGLLIAADQEGGQLIALGPETTQFAGNMALGAAGDPDLARRVGAAAGREMAALGVNINYAPVCDLMTNPANPSLGIRSFGDDPELAAGMAAATVEGLQSAGVAATVKHFPGKGEAAVDSHFSLPLIGHDMERLDTVELRPFRAGIEAGAQLIMSGHFALPALTGRDDLPLTLAGEALSGLARERLGFEGVVITDALDMGALSQGTGQVIDVIAALRAGVDLLLLTVNDDAERIYAGLRLAYSRRLIEDRHLEASAGRIARLQGWLARQAQPPLEVVGSAEHRALARELAERSLTLVRDDAGLLPLRPAAGDRLLVIVPETRDLTPADTSSYERIALAEALRRYHPRVEELVVPHAPDDGEIAAAAERAAGCDLLVAATLNASLNPAQAALVNRLLETGRPLVAAALRTPYDLGVYPGVGTYACTYNLLADSMEALAAGLFGELPFPGRLPVELPGLYPRGHGRDGPGKRA